MYNDNVIKEVNNSILKKSYETFKNGEQKKHCTIVPLSLHYCQ